MTHRVLSYNLLDGPDAGWLVATCVTEGCHWSYVSTWSVPQSESHEASVGATLDALYAHRDSTRHA